MAKKFFDDDDLDEEIMVDKMADEEEDVLEDEDILEDEEENEYVDVLDDDEEDEAPKKKAAPAKKDVKKDKKAAPAKKDTAKKEKKEEKQSPRISPKFEEPDEATKAKFIKIMKAVNAEGYTFEGLVVSHAKMFNIPIAMARDEVKRSIISMSCAISLFDNVVVSKFGTFKKSKMKISEEAKEAMKGECKKDEYYKITFTMAQALKDLVQI